MLNPCDVANVHHQDWLLDLAGHGWWRKLLAEKLLLAKEIHDSDIPTQDRGSDVLHAQFKSCKFVPLRR